MLSYGCTRCNPCLEALQSVTTESIVLATSCRKLLQQQPERCYSTRFSSSQLNCRLEVGLQSTYEDVARDTNRGHTVASVGECFRMAKNAGFKVCRQRADLHMQLITPAFELLQSWTVLEVSQFLWWRACRSSRT